MKRIENFINGEWLQPSTNTYLENFEPATGQVYTEIARSNREDIDRAVAAADASLNDWQKTSTLERAAWLERVAARIEARLDEFARAESRDTGKPLSLATRLDIPRAISNFRFFASAILQFSTQAFPTEHHAINYTTQSPVGIVAAITPWNLPLYLLSWKVAPALAAGNAVIAKPSELTPMTAQLLSEVFQEIGFPRGVFNIVHGMGVEAGQPLVAHPKVRAISFTGGTQTGASIASMAAPQFKKVSLELGGKNPSLVFADCRYEDTLESLVRSSFLNQGQICLCSSRILIQKEIYTRFQKDFVERVRALKWGDPLEATTDQGAVISKAHLQKLISATERAQGEGAKILTGGQALKLKGRCEQGWFFEPTVLEGLSNSAFTNQEEIFGPITALIPFSDEAEAIRLANATRYGLSASIWSQDVSRCHAVAEAIEAGIVWVNAWLLRDLRTPFGGVKDSGLGREGGFDALKFVTEQKNICIKFA